MNQAETDAKTAITKATEAQANSLPLNGNAVSASKLGTARKLGVNLQTSAFQNFDGTADVTNIGIVGHFLLQMEVLVIQALMLMD